MRMESLSSVIFIKFFQMNVRIFLNGLAMVSPLLSLHKIAQVTPSNNSFGHLIEAKHWQEQLCRGHAGDPISAMSELLDPEYLIFLSEVGLTMDIKD